MLNEYRCNLTYDIEELIAMKTNGIPTKFTVTAHYKSGRTEEINGELNKGGVLGKAAQKRIAELRSFPTVEKVDVRLY